MSALGNLVGDIGALAGDRGSTTSVRLTKNPELAGPINQATTDFGATRTASNTGLQDYIRQYLAGNPAARTQTGQEVGAINRYYNGDVESQLAQMRAQRAAAGQEAVNRALAYNTANLNRSRLAAGGSGGSSYMDRLGLNTAADINLQNSLANIAQQRADWNQVMQNQIGLAGQRTNLQNQLAARALVPAQATQANYGWQLGALGNLLSLYNNNNMYGTQYNAPISQKIGNTVGDVAQIGADVYTGGAAGAFMGGMGGGMRTGTSYGPNMASPAAQGWYSGPPATTTANGWNPSVLSTPMPSYSYGPYMAASAAPASGWMPGSEYQ